MPNGTFCIIFQRSFTDDGLAQYTQAEFLLPESTACRPQILAVADQRSAGSMRSGTSYTACHFALLAPRYPL